MNFINLSVFSDIVAKTDKTSLEFFRLQATTAALVEMIKRFPKFIHLVITNSFAISCQYLKLNNDTSYKMCSNVMSRDGSMDICLN